MNIIDRIILSAIKRPAIASFLAAEYLKPIEEVDGAIKELDERVDREFVSIDAWESNSRMDEREQDREMQSAIEEKLGGLDFSELVDVDQASVEILKAIESSDSLRESLLGLINKGA